MAEDTQRWKQLAAQIAVDSIRATTAAGSGHPTSSMSCAELLAVLFADHLRFDVKDPAYRGNDRFVLSKGHAAPALYASHVPRRRWNHGVRRRTTATRHVLAHAPLLALEGA